MNKKRSSNGDKFAQAIARKLAHAGLEILETNNSGACHGDGDILVKDFMIDCKLQEHRGGTAQVNLSLKHAEMIKLCQEAINHLKKPCLIVGNGIGNVYAVVRLEDFIDLLKKD